MSDVRVMDAEDGGRVVAPCGPIVLGGERIAAVLLRNPHDEEARVSQGALVGCLVDLGEKEQILSSALTAFDDEVEIEGDSDLGASTPRYGDSTGVRNSRVAIPPAELSLSDALEGPPLERFADACAAHCWADFEGPDYKEELLSYFDSQRREERCIRP
jgi:hypothetical protein